ncbi:energy-coupling factor transporter transmembrane component T family protein [Ktedonobacter robiniae]|uniref:Cobalt ABC transporter permease n=1 Tax=Ktedonobacter robiniae TaxID=2778365 RepID=A0ABQ3V175_9CHLR|nr:energy-coupling factor transporter transmembrane component T [Ktedonobacter robiniae]GHO58726.1 cobalt ABC transporter permease [Ktedonobacter robiniae]
MLINFPYVERDTLVHRLDVRAKLLFLVAFSLMVAQTSNFWFMLAAFLVSAFYYQQCHLHWRETRAAWRFVIVLNVMIVLGNFFLTNGAVVRGVDVASFHVLTHIPFPGFISHAPYLSIISLPISVESLVFLLTQALRNFSIAFLAISFPYTTNPGHIASGIKGLGLSDWIAYAIELSFRFLPSVGRDFSTTLDAQRARGFELDKLRGGIFGKIARLAPLIVPLVIGSIIGAEDIINAMELRCFGVGKRTWLYEAHASRSDIILIALCIIAFVCVTSFNILGGFSSFSIFHTLHTQGIPASWLH